MPDQGLRPRGFSLPSSSSIRKGLSLLKRPSFLNGVLRYRVAAATEHLGAINLCAANTLIDVGANKGQFSLAFRSVRPQARIIAFEPLPMEADKYERAFASDDSAELIRVALANSAGSAEFHVADRADSSSLLRLGLGQQRAFGVRAVDAINVRVDRLENRVDFSELLHPVMMKVDVQGAELEVFEGCESLREVDFIYVELSFVELYEGQPLLQEVCNYLLNRGFMVAGFFNQVTTARFGPTQVDLLFKRAQELAGI